MNLNSSAALEEGRNRAYAARRWSGGRKGRDSVPVARSLHSESIAG